MIVTTLAASVSPFVRAVTSVNGTWNGVAVAAFVIERATFSFDEVPAFGAEGAISFMLLSSSGCFYDLLSPLHLLRQELRQEGAGCEEKAGQPSAAASRGKGWGVQRQMGFWWRFGGSSA